MIEKTCSKCGESKPLSEFHVRADRPAGYQPACKSCRNKRVRKVALRKPRASATVCPKQKAKNLAQDKRKAAIPGHLALKAERARLWRAKNPAKGREYRANRRAKLLQATPAWADKKTIARIYALAEQQRKVGKQRVEVHHRVPLNSKKVCGLHVPDNLQIVVHDYNMMVSNQKWPGMS